MICACVHVGKDIISRRRHCCCCTAGGQGRFGRQGMCCLGIENQRVWATAAALGQRLIRRQGRRRHAAHAAFDSIRNLGANTRLARHIGGVIIGGMRLDQFWFGHLIGAAHQPRHPRQQARLARGGGGIGGHIGGGHIGHGIACNHAGRGRLAAGLLAGLHRLCRLHRAAGATAQ